MHISDNAAFKYGLFFTCDIIFESNNFVREKQKAAIFAFKWVTFCNWEEEGWTWKLEKMAGWRFLISNAGITTLVNVCSNFVFPSFSLTSLCKYLPSYCGPIRLLPFFIAVAIKFQLLYLGKNHTVN